jgi:hypothetical protein
MAWTSKNTHNVIPIPIEPIVNVIKINTTFIKKVKTIKKYIVILAKFLPINTTTIDNPHDSTTIPTIIPVYLNITYPNPVLPILF